MKITSFGQLRWRSVVLGAAMAWIGWLAWQRWSEPRWQGRNVAEWFREYQLSLARSQRKGREAIQALTALRDHSGPYLIHQAQKTGEFSPFIKAAAWISREVPRGLLSQLGPLLARLERQAELESARPVAALRALGELRLPAEMLLQVSPMLSDPNPIYPLKAIEILGTAGSGAEACVPLLTPFFGSTNHSLQQSALRSVSELEEASAAAVPELTRLLAFPESAGVTFPTLKALGRIGPKAILALPAIRGWGTPGAATNRFMVRQAALSALAIDPGQTWASDWLRTRLDASVLSHFTTFTNVAALFVPELWHLAGGPELDEWLLSVDLLYQLKVDPNRLIRTVERRLASAAPGSDDELNSVHRLFLLQPEHPEAIRNMIRYLQSSDPTWVLSWLSGSEVGAAGSSLLLEVRKLVADPNPEIQRQAKQTWFEMTGQL